MEAIGVYKTRNGFVAEYIDPNNIKFTVWEDSESIARTKMEDLVNSLNNIPSKAERTKDVITTETVQYWGTPPQTVTRINGFRI